MAGGRSRRSARPASGSSPSRPQHPHATRTPASSAIAGVADDVEDPCRLLSSDGDVHDGATSIRTTGRMMAMSTAATDWLRDQRAAAREPGRPGPRPAAGACGGFRSRPVVPLAAASLQDPSGPASTLGPCPGCPDVLPAPNARSRVASNGPADTRWDGDDQAEDQGLPRSAFSREIASSGPGGEDEPVQHREAGERWDADRMIGDVRTPRHQHHDRHQQDHADLEEQRESEDGGDQGHRPGQHPWPAFSR